MTGSPKENYGAMGVYTRGPGPVPHTVFELRLGRCSSTWFRCKCLKIQNNSSSNKMDVYLSLA